MSKISLVPAEQPELIKVELQKEIALHVLAKNSTLVYSKSVFHLVSLHAYVVMTAM